MEYVQGGDLPVHKSILLISSFWLSYYLLGKCPKLGIQLPNAGGNNHNFRISTVLFNQIDLLRVSNYNIYSSTLFYTNVYISTLIRGGEEVGMCVPVVNRGRM